MTLHFRRLARRLFEWVAFNHRQPTLTRASCPHPPGEPATLARQSAAEQALINGRTYDSYVAGYPRQTVGSLVSLLRCWGAIDVELRCLARSTYARLKRRSGRQQLCEPQHDQTGCFRRECAIPHPGHPE